MGIAELTYVGMLKPLPVRQTNCPFIALESLLTAWLTPD